MESFLLSLQMEQYVDALAACGVAEISELRALSHEELGKIIQKPGHVKKILKQVSQIETTELTSPQVSVRSPVENDTPFVPRSHPLTRAPCSPRPNLILTARSLARRSLVIIFSHSIVTP